MAMHFLIDPKYCIEIFVYEPEGLIKFGSSNIWPNWLYFGWQALVKEEE